MRVGIAAVALRARRMCRADGLSGWPGTGRPRACARGTGQARRGQPHRPRDGPVSGGRVADARALRRLPDRSRRSAAPPGQTGRIGTGVPRRVGHAGNQRSRAGRPARGGPSSGVRARCLREAEAALAKKDMDTASVRLKAILLEDPQHEGARALLRKIDQQNAKPAPETALAAAYRKPITIEFKDVALRTVFEVISRTSGLNFLFDKDVKTDQKTSIFLKNSTIENAVNLTLLTNQLDQRVLDANTVLIYPNTQAKQKDYQPLTVKSFYLVERRGEDGRRHHQVPAEDARRRRGRQAQPADRARQPRGDPARRETGGAARRGRTGSDARSGDPRGQAHQPAGPGHPLAGPAEPGAHRAAAPAARSPYRICATSTAPPSRRPLRP